MKRTRVLVAAAVTAGVALAAGGIGVAAAATNPPALAFIAATTNVTAVRYVDGDFHYFDFDLGVNLIAGQSPFEIRASRKSYATPIVAQQIVTVNGKKKAVTLPAGLVTGFDGFKNFTTITIKNTAGATVKNYQTNFCPNDGPSARTRRDAPASTPYPQGCNGYNPFTLGSVWGIQAGWNASTSSYPAAADPRPGGGDDFDLAPGTYSVTVALSPAYQKYFKISAASSTIKLHLTVENATVGSGLARAKAVAAATSPAAAAAAADEHSAHAGQQISGYLPGFRPPAKVSATLKATPQVGPKPDLRALPAWGISVAPGQKPTGEPDGKWYVNFGATVWNAGTSPLLVDGFRRTGTQLMDAYQYFFDAKGKQVGSVKAGTMQWDPRTGHKHWHFTDFAQYNLLSADKKLKVRSGKEAFCLANTDAIDYTLPNAMWRPYNTDLSTACGGNTAVAVREVLDIGNGDTYSQDRPGQSFEITNLPNGTYYIQVLANPAKKLAEVSTTNNTSLRQIILGGTPTARTITVPPVNGIEG
jgi:lysyl oxidase